MKVKVGCDIVEIKRFNKLDNKVLNKIFHRNELQAYWKRITFKKQIVPIVE